MTVVCNKKYERTRSIEQIGEVIRTELARYPEIIEYQVNASGGMGGGGRSTVDVEIYGYDFDETNLYAEEVRQAIVNNVPGARNVRVSRDKDRPELKVIIDKEKAAIHGLNTATVSQYIRNRVAGFTAGFLKEDGDEYIDRKSRQRYVRVISMPYETSLGELAAAIQAQVDQLPHPSGISVVLAGDFDDQQKTFKDIFALLLLIILLVYIVMASQFESLGKPAVILLSIPFGLSGVVLALWITGTSLDMIGALGVVMLVGIVVKNGIVLVDYINLMRDRGHALNEAIALSGASRLRPVLMTAFTTLLGMLPMALSGGEGSEMWHPLGIVVIGGLLVSTFVTLIIVPVVYGLISRHGERDKEEKRRKEFIFMQLNPDQEAAK